MINTHKRAYCAVNKMQPDGLGWNGHFLWRKKKQFFNASKLGLLSTLSPPRQHLRSSLSAQLTKKGIATSPLIPPFLPLSPARFLILNTDNLSLHVNGFNSSLFNVAFYVEFYELLSLTRFTGNLFNSHPQVLACCNVTGSIEGSAVAFIEKAGRQVSERSSRQTQRTLISSGVLLQSISNSQVSFFLKNNY